MDGSLSAEDIRHLIDLSWKRLAAEAKLYYPRNTLARPFGGGKGIRSRTIRKLKRALLTAVDAPDPRDFGFKMRRYISGLALNKPRAAVYMLCDFIAFEKRQAEKAEQAALRARRKGKAT